MPAMSQFNFDEQTRGELPRTRTLFFAQRDLLTLMGLTAAVPSNHVSPLQGEGSGQTRRDKGGQREREKVKPLLTQWALLAGRTSLVCQCRRRPRVPQSAAKNVSERAENVPGLRTGQTV